MKEKVASFYDEELSSDYKTVTKEEEKIFEKVMKSLVRIYFIAVVVLFVSEIGVFFALAKSGELYQDTTLYFFRRVFLPSLINFGVTIFTSTMLKKEDINFDLKKFLVAFNFFVICEVIVIFHSYFTCTNAVLTLPIIISMLFKKVENVKRITICSALGSIVHILIQAKEYIDASITYHLLNYGVMLAIYFVLYILCKKIIEFENEKNKAVAKAFENQKKLNFEMFHDELTELYNYRGFKNELDTRVGELKENKINSLIMCLLDLDAFSEINKIFGNEIGDDILKVFASLLNKEANNEVYVARYEGEKFVLLYANRTPNDVIESLKRIKESVYDYKYPQLSEGTISFGCGIVPYQNEMTTDDYIMLAVKALKKAKSNGKNQTIIVK